MKNFVDIQKIWNGLKKNTGITNLIHNKLKILLLDTSEEGVGSCFILLSSFGDEAICEILEEREKQIQLREDLGIIHRYLWKLKIISFVENNNTWKHLWEHGYFDSLVQSCFQEMRDGGITTVGEFHYFHHHQAAAHDWSHDREIVEACKEVGIRI